jgi:hypothetical protein
MGDDGEAREAQEEAWRAQGCQVPAAQSYHRLDERPHAQVQPV